jgi:hypothetical protein
LGESSAPPIRVSLRLAFLYTRSEFNAAGRRAKRPGIPLSIAPRICHVWNEVRLSSSVSAFFGSRPGEHRTGRSDPDAIRFGHADTFGNAHSNSDTHRHADTHGHADNFGNAHSDSDTHGHADNFGNAHSDSDAHGHTDAHGHANTFGNAHSDSDAHGLTDAHGHANTFGNAHRDSDAHGLTDAHGHANTFGNAHGDSDAHGHADTHGDANGNTGCRDRSLPLLQGEDCAGFRSLRKARCGGSAESVHRKLEHEPGQAPAIL